MCHTLNKIHKGLGVRQQSNASSTLRVETKKQKKPAAGTGKELSFFDECDKNEDDAVSCLEAKGCAGSHAIDEEEFNLKHHTFVLGIESMCRDDLLAKMSRAHAMKLLKTLKEPDAEFKIPPQKPLGQEEAEKELAEEVKEAQDAEEAKLEELEETIVGKEITDGNLGDTDGTKEYMAGAEHMADADLNDFWE